MKIFLDSTELTQYNLLNTKNSSIQKMFDMSERELINIYISQIVLDEVEKNNILTIKAISKKISKDINEISKYDIGNCLNDIKTNSEIEDCFKSRVDELQNIYNVEIVEYPRDSNIVELLINKYKNRLAPFHNKTDSWKDYLIWLSYKKIIETIDDEDIIFISANTSDFSKDKGESLHPDFTIEGKNIQYYKTYKDFSDENNGNTKYKDIITQYENTLNLENISDIIENFKNDEYEIKQMIEKDFIDECKHVIEEDISPDDYMDDIIEDNFHCGWSFHTYDYNIEDIKDIDIEDIEILDKDRLLVNIPFSVYINADALTPNSGRDSWEDHFIREEVLFEVSNILTFIHNIKDNKNTDIKFKEIKNKYIECSLV